MVAAAANNSVATGTSVNPPVTPPYEHTRSDTTNFGSRVDCFAWGANVATLDTALFTGTSAASAIIAGAALVVQGVSNARGNALRPEALRDALKKDGTESKDPPQDRIGVMPDLDKVL
jgi:hypothetical protein